VLGASAYAILSLVNGTKFGEDGKTIVQNGIVQGAALVLTGILVRKLNPSDYKLGKKYKLALMQF
jgi:hypothetical protein